MFKTMLKSVALCGLIVCFNTANAQVYIDSSEGNLGNLASSPWQTNNTGAGFGANINASSSGSYASTSGYDASGYVAEANTIAGPKSDATLVGNKVPLPTFVGENTTWTKAVGQKSIAPEVNIANMLIMTDHLRNLGYQIPPEFDDFIKNAPSNARDKIMSALGDIRSANDVSKTPVEASFNHLLKLVEKHTGFDITNVFDTTFNLLDNGPK